MFDVPTCMNCIEQIYRVLQALKNICAQVKPPFSDILRSTSSPPKNSSSVGYYFDKIMARFFIEISSSAKTKTMVNLDPLNY